jgi:hypothetical protein
MVRRGDLERKTETDRERARLASARHLKDLNAAHGKPPPDVAVRPTKMPVRIAAAPESSNCTSPGALCAELMS